MSETSESFERMANMMATMATEMTPKSIREAVANVRAMPLFHQVDDEAAEQVARKIEHRHSVSMGYGHILTDTDVQYQPWLDSAKPTMDRYY
jgi:hypothetical protein